MKHLFIQRTAPSRSAIKFDPSYNAASGCLQDDDRVPISFQAKQQTIAVKFRLGNPRPRRRRDRDQVGLTAGGATPRPGTEQKSSDERPEGKKKKHT
jgi:hypothetical protein